MAFILYTFCFLVAFMPIRTASLLTAFPYLLFCALFSGCALAPGQHMNARVIANDGSPESSQVELIPITPKLIAVDESTRSKPVIPAELLTYQPETYHIGSGDVLFITVWDHPEMTAPSGAQSSGESNGRTVRPDGTLFYPYAGNIQAAGRTIEDLRTEIASRLTRYIDNPQVDVNVLRFASQQVLLSGAFEKTLPVPITTKPLSLMEALGIGSINTREADLSSLTLIRNGNHYKMDVYALTREPSEIHNVYLQDGDTLDLPYNDNNKVYVLGEVARPQALLFKAGSMNLTDAIGSVGGLTQLTSKGQDVYVIRGVHDLAKEKAKIFQLNAKSPSAFILSGKFQLYPQDVVYVGSAGVTRWNRVLSQLLPSLNLLGTSARTVDAIDDVSNQLSN